MNNYSAWIRPEAWVPIAASAIVGVLSLLSLFGVMESKWFAEKTPGITLTLLSLVLGFLAFEMTEVIQFIRREPLERVRALSQRLGPFMNSIFGAHIESTITLLRDALQGNIVHCKDPALFREFYQHTLERLEGKKTRLCATSLPYERYFWRGGTGGEAIEGAIRSFIQSGGQMTRIFFVYPSEVAADTEVRSVLKAQLDMGIAVYAVDPDTIPQDLHKLFVVDEAHRISWVVEVEPNKSRIKNATFSMDAPTNERLWNDFERLRKLPSTRHLPTLPPAASPGAPSPVPPPPSP